MQIGPEGPFFSTMESLQIRFRYKRPKQAEVLTHAITLQKDSCKKQEEIVFVMLTYLLKVLVFQVFVLSFFSQNRVDDTIQ